jgi:hypothetical protein
MISRFMRCLDWRERVVSAGAGSAFDLSVESCPLKRDPRFGNRIAGCRRPMRSQHSSQRVASPLLAPIYTAGSGLGMKIYCNQAGILSPAINSSYVPRGRTTADLAPETRTSGAKSREL